MTGQRYFVSTGRFALRGIGHAQDLYTLDPALAKEQALAERYERYLAGK
jgi:adenylate cyclase